MSYSSPYCLNPVPCAPHWVARRTYTARCSSGLFGEPITVTREFKSFVSLAHAEATALSLAKRDAEAALVCCYRAEEMWTAPDGHIETAVAYSCSSQQEAERIAIRHAYVKANGLTVSEHEAWLFNYRPVGGSNLLNTQA